MQKIPDFKSSDYEFSYFVTMTMKNAMATQAIEARLNTMIEAINELIDNANSNVDLETFKETFLKELATLLNQNTEFEFTESLFNLLGSERTDLKESFDTLELTIKSLADRISKIESALGHEKIEKNTKPNALDLLGT